MRLQSMMRKPMGARNMSGHSMEHAYGELDAPVEYCFLGVSRWSVEPESSA